ncbi:glycoside hydrolase [Paenibacillus sp. LHD-38]|uniref:family 4 glycosyl hydrolase n=1 Tax=Paenibacillus sp. LHD-38 TaxID=3072143 RepID=UPI00280D2035|nr:glycoside hydrolase [Paenibacillus sp. LHD-38]MDQ8734726.1 glycoside hydrolase [Paenibacillus sp. LHD-38]
MKIVIIGGAGVRTVLFIHGLIARYQQLGIKKVVLYDIAKEKLDVIGKLCSYVMARENAQFEVETSNDIREALQDADHVVTTLRVGNDHSRVIDEEVALSHGVIGQETTGAGGFSMAVRTIPVLVEYCKIIKEIVPNAWIFNFTNPSGLVTQALRNLGFDKVIGICDAPSSTIIRMAKALEIDPNHMYVEFFGLNHLSWIGKVIFEGKDLLPELVNDEKFLSKVEEFNMFDFSLIKSMGYLPNEYLYYFYHREQAIDHIIKSGNSRGKNIENINTLMMNELLSIDMDANPEEALQTFLYYMESRESSYMSIEANKEKNVTIEKGHLEIPDSMGYAGVMLDCIEALQTDESKQVILSVPNNGSMDGLEDSDVIEVTCNVSRKGFEPVHIGKIPEHMYVLVKTIKLYEKLTIDAIMNKSPELAIRALTVHPLVFSYSLAKKLVDGYTKEYGGLL